jgi:hypothetical protein
MGEGWVGVILAAARSIGCEASDPRRKPINVDFLTKSRSGARDTPVTGLAGITPTPTLPHRGGGGVVELNNVRSNNV